MPKRRDIRIVARRRQVIDKEKITTVVVKVAQLLAAKDRAPRSRDDQEAA